MCPCYEHETDGCACGASALHVFNWLIILPVSFTPVLVLALQLGAMSEAQLEEFSRHAGMPAGVHPSCACACAFSMCISYSRGPFFRTSSVPPVSCFESCAGEERCACVKNKLEQIYKL